MAVEIVDETHRFRQAEAAQRTLEALLTEQGSGDRDLTLVLVDDATIAVPDRSTTWALRELVVLHEVAHHLSQTEPAHGTEFTSTLCELADAVMGPEVAYVLRVVYAKEGVR